MERKIKWGILGPGRIAHSFAKGLKSLEDAEIVAVGSRDLEKSQEFAKKYSITNAYGSYQDLVNDKDVDIIYVATPHPFHKDCALLCLNAGKAVICEKPLTINAKESAELIACAKKNQVFLMEGMWTRFLPVTVKVMELISSGIIGDIKMIKADFGFCCGPDPSSRLLNPELGGGALLDVGVYVISYVSMLLGGETPLSISSIANIGESKVDEEFSAIIGYDGGKIATVSGAIKTNIPQDVMILGTKGRIQIPNFWHGNSVTVDLDNKDSQVYQLPFEASGFNYEAAEAIRCIKTGKLESDIMPLSESLTIIKIMDTIREQWSFKYPFE